jgi:hypothetical protein
MCHEKGGDSDIPFKRLPPFSSRAVPLGMFGEDNDGNRDKAVSHLLKDVSAQRRLEILN